MSTRKPSQERIAEIVSCAIREGDEYAEAQYSINHESLRRYKRFYRQQLEESGDTHIEDVSTDRLLREIANKLSHEELQTIARSGTLDRSHKRIDADWFEGDTLRVGVISDTHIGSLYFRDDWLQGALDRFAHDEVDIVVHVGDVTEGMSNRPGHIYELQHLGYSEQKQAAIEQLQPFTSWPLYMIDGNHDRWFIKSNGAKIVQDIAADLPNTQFIGHDTGAIDIAGIAIQLWHGEDGSSYAHSYRLQKVIEALPGGGKPNILLTGHVHKSGYFFERNVHAILSGCIEEQTPFMRGKRLPAHTGFWTIEADIHDGSVVRFSPTFYPFY